MYESEQTKEWKESIIDFKPSNDQGSIRGGMTAQTETETQVVILDKGAQKHLRTIDQPKRVDARLIIGGFIIISMTVLGLVKHHYLSAQLARLVHWSKTLGWLCPVLIFGLSAMLPVIMLPCFPVMALSGPLFTEMYGGNPVAGGSMAFASVFGGLSLGSVIAFSLGKTVFKNYAIKAGQESATLKQLNRIIDGGGGVKIVLMARALPILPAEIFDYAVALTSLKIWQYAIGCIGSAVPVAFWTFSSAEASVAAKDGMSAKGGVGAHLWLVVINIVALVALTVLLYYTIKRQTPPSEEEDAVVSASPVHIFIRRTISNFRLGLVRCCGSPGGNARPDEDRDALE